MSAKRFPPFRACCSFLKTRKDCVFSEALLRAKNVYEFRHRLKWLSEGSLMFYLSLGTHQAFSFVKSCDQEKDFYNFLLKTFDKE
jgi:hypothetical protein